MSARVCVSCLGSWPPSDTFKTCPRCGSRTEVDPNGRTHKIGLPKADVERQVLEFREWLDGLGPEDMARWG